MHKGRGFRRAPCLYRLVCIAWPGSPALGQLIFLLAVFENPLSPPLEVTAFTAK